MNVSELIIKFDSMVNEKLTKEELWDKIKDRFGWTPLHELASVGAKEAWLHPDFYKIKSNKGETPKDVWAYFGYKPLSTMDLAELKRKQKNKDSRDKVNENGGFGLHEVFKVVKPNKQQIPIGHLIKVVNIYEDPSGVKDYGEVRVLDLSTQTFHKIPRKKFYTMVGDSLERRRYIA